MQNKNRVKHDKDDEDDKDEDEMDSKQTVILFGFFPFLFTLPGKCQ